MKTNMPALLAAILVLGGLAALAARGPGVGQDQPRFRVESDIVRVPLVVVDKNGNLYGGLKKGNFTILEDGKPQQIETLSGGEASLTLVLLLEHSRIIQCLLGEVLRPAGIFVTQILQRGDFASIIAFDANPRILSDFTRNRQQLINSINNLSKSPPGFSESNLFDAVAFTLVGGMLDEVEYKGISAVEGRTGVLLVASGIDTFSDYTLDEIRNLVAAAGVPIYSIGIGELAHIRAEPYLSGSQRLDYLRARTNLDTLSKESGGRFYSVRFQGALDDVLESIHAMLSHQFTLGYRPGRKPVPGEKRTIKVLVDLDGDGRNDNDRLDLNYRRFYYIPDSEDEWRKEE